MLTHRAVLARALIALALVRPVAAMAAAPPPRLEDVLSLAGRYVTPLEEQLSILVADETLAPVFVGREGSAWQRRALVSDVAWVPTGDPFVWAFFRDVREVDGTASGWRPEARPWWRADSSCVRPVSLQS